MSEAPQEQIKVRALKPGQPLATDLLDDKGVLLLRAGVVITEGFIETLLRRGIDTVAKRETEEARQAREAAEAEAQAAKTKKQNPVDRVEVSAATSADGPVDPNSGELTYRPGAIPTNKLSVGELNAMAVQAERAFDGALDRYLDLGPGLAYGEVNDLGFASELVAGFNRYAAADSNLVLSLLKMKGDPQDTLYRHALKSALLTMTLARRIGFADTQVIDGGVAALVHDLGMLRVPEAVRGAQRKLTAIEWAQVHEHPTHTLNILDRITGVSDSVKTAAYQVHERCDASGYPKKRPKQFIHPMAKVIAIADTYAALTDHRPHRRALNGHEAMKTILRDVQAGRFDRGVARALLDTMSLFPVGTNVGLSDGRDAVVLRGVPGQATKPVVVVIKDGDRVDWELDLTQVDDLSITRVIEDEAAVAA